MKPAFKTEADLCASFIAWAQEVGVQCYAEWHGWDILAVYPDGTQLGIQAKLRLNAEVIGQAAPDAYGWALDRPGPDFRAVLVPALTPLSDVAGRLGLVVFWPSERGYPKPRIHFYPGLREGRDLRGDAAWFDWNPATRHDLPPVPTDAVAGSPCPVKLTHWKLGALAVLAEVAVKGSITTKRMRELGVNPSRWLSGRWLVPSEKRGDWVRGEHCPKFEDQHPKAYAVALEKAQAVPA